MRHITRLLFVGSILGLSTAVLFFGANQASAAQPPVGLGVATSFAVLAGSTITNTGPSVIHGDVGLSPGTATPGLNSLPGPATVDGTQHINDGVAANAKSDLVVAYNDAAGRTPVNSASADLAGQTLDPGIYAGPTLGLTGTVTLDAHNDPSAVFVFKATSTLTTASSSVVALVRGASPCNVYWQIGSSATLGTNSTFVGTVMALTSITATTGAVIQGRLLARNAAVTLDDNTITRPSCRSIPAGPGPGSSSSSSKPGGAKSSTPGGGRRGTGTGSPKGGTGGGHGVPLQASGSTTNGGPNAPSSSTPFQPPRLARTGSDTSSLALGGGVAVVAGASLLLIARRRIVTGRHHR